MLEKGSKFQQLDLCAIMSHVETLCYWPGWKQDVGAWFNILANLVKPILKIYKL